MAPTDDHHHLVCNECGRTVDVPMEDLAGAIADVTAPHGFVADGAHFAIVGRCSDCAGGR